MCSLATHIEITHADITSPILFTNIRNWLTAARKVKFSDSEKHVQKVEILNRLDLQSTSYDDEITWLEGFLKRFHSPIVFCHNDAQEGNWMWDREEQHQLHENTQGEHNDNDDRQPNNFPSTPSRFSAPILHLIDYEYSHYNYRGFDLANHICEHYIENQASEYPGFELNTAFIPDEKHLRRFFKAYLQQWRETKVTDSGFGCFAVYEMLDQQVDFD